MQFLFGAGGLALLAAAPACATELCVKCTGPDASYACVVGSGSNSTLDTVSKFYCITTLAKAGQHASCSIDRSFNPPCPGERRELPIPAFLNNPAGDGQPNEAPSEPKPHGNDAGPPTELPPQPGPPAPPQNAAVEPPASEPPPKTVEEMVEKSAKSAGAGLSQTQKSAGDAAKSASTALEKAGSAVGGAAKSSWKCLSSFFSNC
ncbi:MAG: hypothetical protein QM780_02330 [Hyphomicrobium sp.]|uniref:hypothetical protein n=1 Tax=Hyphomicrobium sp. TaxID=82 RepID=UPI0039E530AB